MGILDICFGSREPNRIWIDPNKQYGYETYDSRKEKDYRFDNTKYYIQITSIQGSTKYNVTPTRKEDIIPTDTKYFNQINKPHEGMFKSITDGHHLIVTGYEGEWTVVLEEDAASCLGCCGW